MTTHVTQFADGLPRYAFSVDEVSRMTELGVFAHDSRFELLGGEIVPMAPKNIVHERMKHRLNRYLARVADGLGFDFTPETDLVLSDSTFLEPDFVLYAPEIGLDGLSAETVLLAVEVADTSLAYDRGRKAEIYAAHGVRELWVIDARASNVVVHREPGPTGYGVIDVHEEDRVARAAFVTGLTLTLADMR